MIADALKLSVYLGESVPSGSRLAADAVMDCFDRHGLAVSALVRGIEGFGMNRRIHAQRFPDVSTDLPLLAWAVDDRERIQAALDDVDRAVPRGLVTLERARLATGEDVAGAEFPEGVGRAGKLTIYCGSGERVRGRHAYREAVALLRGHGASGAIVLPGVDGCLHGRRQRVGLFSRGDRTPMVIVSVGPREPLRQALPDLAEVLHEPIVTLEPIAQVKHDGELLEPPPNPAAPAPADVWQTIRVYARRTAQVNGRALYSELTRRLREAGAAGATTILGDWGFSSDEPPHGDKLGRITSHRPTYTVYIDRPEKVAEVWPLIDEVTAEHGIVTSLLVPGYRERADHLASAQQPGPGPAVAGPSPGAPDRAGTGAEAAHALSAAPAMSARAHHVSSLTIPGPDSQTHEAAVGVQCLAALLGRAERDLTLRIGAALAEERCAVDRWHALSLLADGTGHAMATLAEHGLLSPPTLTRLIDAMIADNLVYRKIDERDRRRVLVFATQRGRSLHRRIAARIERRRDDILPREMSREDLARLSELLAALTTPPRPARGPERASSVPDGGRGAPRGTRDPRR